VDRLPVRFAAIVCAAVVGMFMGGAGAVAFANPGNDGNDGGDGGTQNGGLHLPGLSGFPGLGNSPFSRYSAGSNAPPLMNLPQWLGPGSSSPNLANLMMPGSGTRVLGTPLLAPFTLGAPDKGPPDPGPALPITLPIAALPTTVGTPPPLPPISALPLNQPFVPAGQPLTINNPPPDKLPFDLQEPIAPQLLPPPVVAVLMAAAEQVPLAGLVIDPILDAKVPPFIADVVIPALLADIVVPNLQLATVVPTAPGLDVASVTTPALLSAPAAGSLPTELGVSGMDMPQAPQLTPLPPTFGPPHWTSPSQDFTALSDPVAFRAGYSDYLRNAGMAQITAVAVPGAAAILLFTIGGGFIGYRQARAGHVIRAEGMTRFLR
jgi:hypothetical protein